MSASMHVHALMALINIRSAIHLSRDKRVFGPFPIGSIAVGFISLPTNDSVVDVPMM